MKVLVTYMSQTGNTKKVAEVIFEGIEEEKEIKALNEIKTLEGYDLAFVGFPIQRFGPAEEAKNFLEKYGKGKKLALFITHAVPPDFPMLNEWISKCTEPAVNANMVGIFDCQGELSESVSNKLLNNPDPQMQKFGAMREMTLGHPDVTELENAKAFAREVMAKER